LHSVARVRIDSGGFISSGSSSRIKIRDGGSSNNQAGVDVQRPGNGMRTFAIQGKAAGSGSVTDFFYSYANSTNGDAINYTGLVTSDNHIANKKYVDSKMPKYTITQSNGNYYIN